jgi:hypothetical protein
MVSVFEQCQFLFPGMRDRAKSPRPPDFIASAQACRKDSCFGFNKSHRRNRLFSSDRRWNRKVRNTLGDSRASCERAQPYPPLRSVDRMTAASVRIQRTSS